MSLIFQIYLALRYLTGHFKKYIFLFIALSFGFAFISVITSLSEGMYNSAYHAAETHYGGNLFVLGYDRDHGNVIRIADTEEVERIIAESGLEPSLTVYRTNSFQRGVLYFNGRAVQQKNVLGIDWSAEKKLIGRLDFAAGGVNADLSGTNGIIISQPVADMLQVRLGDLILLQIDTLTGQKNTADLIVTGIINDSSLFGYYRSFMDRAYLNSLLGMKKNEYSSVGLFFPDLHGIEEKAFNLHGMIEQVLPSAPFIKDKNSFVYELSLPWQSIRYFVISLPVYVSQVAELLSALKTGSYVLFAMMILIVFSSSVLTYRLVLHERRMEFATMQAVGLNDSNLFLILVFEGLFLTFISIIAGFLFSQVILFIISSFSYSNIPGFDIFMRNGRLAADYKLTTSVINMTVILLAVILALLGPALKSLRADLAHILAGGD